MGLLDHYFELNTRFLSIFEKSIIINKDKGVSTENNFEENIIKEISYEIYCSFSIITIIDMIK